jgi:hypothetical protein
MFDRMTATERSAHMGKIRRMNTKPERTVRSLLHKLGYRFRLQWKTAPGRPDVAFPGRRKILVVPMPRAFLAFATVTVSGSIVRFPWPSRTLQPVQPHSIDTIANPSATGEIGLFRGFPFMPILAQPNWEAFA